MGRIIDGSDVVPCHYCQREVGPGALEFTRDHVVPRALGGQDRRDNVVPCCRDCNGEKADRYPTHDCAFCNRTRRRHWEEFGITDQTKNRKRERKKRIEAGLQEFERLSSSRAQSASAVFEAAQAAELQRNTIESRRGQPKRVAKVGTFRDGWVKTEDGWALARVV